MKNLADKLNNLVGKEIMAVQHICDIEDKSKPGVILIYTENETFELSSSVDNNRNILII